MRPEEFIISCLKKTKTKLVATLPCEKVSSLLEAISENFDHVPLTREEEGVGVCAGAYLAEARGAMLVQSSGVGNMINALCSLTRIYSMPLPILVSWRGVYREGILAQEPMGKYLPKLARALDIPWAEIKRKKDLPLVRESLESAYKNEELQLILLNPRIWGDVRTEEIQGKTAKTPLKFTGRPLEADLTRYEVLEAASSYLDGKAVVCNLGVPCKELYRVKDQPSNFYMLGSMGMATPIGLGMAMYAEKEVVVIDGDGSLLMNPGVLATVAEHSPKNLTILAIDNAAYGSTGNQSTATAEVVDLQMLARAFGIKRTYKVAGKDEIKSVLPQLGRGPNFIHIVAKAGNAPMPNIP
ncbi:MAG: sulfopyruvate decarboxylase subunit alpha, partial [Candidatus Hydrothermarchaeota archaeon]|nr:sulfopyruvate decarboxylase subunit alpha [Candidatus Hydrothermarchaeota archaeon]